MHLLSFLYALCLLVLGVIGLSSASGPGQIRALGLPGLFFGGAVLFCAFFALKEARHGLAGASFLGFLAFLTTIGALLGHLIRGSLDLSHPAQQIGSAICLASFLYILTAFLSWKRTRRLKAIAELTSDPSHREEESSG